MSNKMTHVGTCKDCKTDFWTGRTARYCPKCGSKKLKIAPRMVKVYRVKTKGDE